MKEKHTCILTINTIVDDQHLVKRYQKQKKKNKNVAPCFKFTLPQQRKNIIPSLKLPKTFSKQFIYFQQVFILIIHTYSK